MTRAKAGSIHRRYFGWSAVAYIKDHRLVVLLSVLATLVELYQACGLLNSRFVRGEGVHVAEAFAHCSVVAWMLIVIVFSCFTKHA